MPKKHFCFVDVETTGTNAVSGRIIEIGIIKVFENRIVEEFETLINPELRIDPFIEQMTGIGFNDLDKAPVFSEVKDKIFETLSDSIFVAHNVRFDYGFIRNEFKRYGMNFTSKHFDTIKLARILYPGHSRYSLDAIMERYNITNPARHRALGDARVLWDFWQICKKNVKENILEDALKIALKKPSLPKSLTQEMINKLPESAGVYTFYGDSDSILYIGKSVNVRERVLSHFTNDYASNSDMKISQSVKYVDAIETEGELSALLLESEMIKKYKPIFNKVLRESRKMSVLLKTTDKNGFNTVAIKEADEIEAEEIEQVLGVFRNNKQLEEYLYGLCKEFKLCPRIMGLEKGRGRCFYSQIGQCNGACNGKESILKYNLRFDEALLGRKIKKWSFDGPLFIKENPDSLVGHLIDKWCYLGKLHEGDDGADYLNQNYRFDYDIYKILRRFLVSSKNFKKLTIKKADLSSLKPYESLT